MPLLPNEVKTENIASGAVTTPKIADEAVTSVKIKASAITADKIAVGAITSSKIGEGQIYGAKLKDGAVRAEKIAAGAVTTPKIGELQVTTSRIQDKAVTNEKLANSAVTTEKIANGAVTQAKLSFTPPSVARPITPSVATDELANGSVTTPKIADGAVIPAKLSFTVPSRPLTPPIATAEIGDAQVTPAKLSFVPLARPLVPAIETAEIADASVIPTKLPVYGRLPGYIGGLRMQTVVLMGPFRRVAISIAEIVVENIRLSAISLEANLGNSGAGGLDTGVPTVDTWYYIYIITNADGTLVASLISLSPATPNLPVGYTRKRRIGAARASNPALPSFLPYTQIDNTVLYTDAFEVNRLVNAGGAIIFTMINAAAYIPPTSRRGRFYLAVIGSSANVGDYVGLAIRHPDMLNASGQFIITQCTQVAGANVATTGMGDCDTDYLQQIYYSLKLTGPAVGSAYIDVVGFYDSL